MCLLGSGGCDDIEIENISLPHLSSIYQSNESKASCFIFTYFYFGSTDSR